MTRYRFRLRARGHSKTQDAGAARLAQELAMVESYDRFYGGERAPVPEGVAALWGTEPGEFIIDEETHHEEAPGMRAWLDRLAQKSPPPIPEDGGE